MIPRDEELSLAVEIRNTLLTLLSGVEDSSSFSWDPASPNWLTKSRIEEAATAIARQLVALGAVEIELHGDCGRLGHEDRASSVGRSSGHWCVAVPGLKGRHLEIVKDGSGIMTIDGRVHVTDLDDCLRLMDEARVPCPCSPGTGKSEHSRCQHFAWPPDPESRLRELANIQMDLRLAAQAAGDRTRRSSIREKLLVALINLERLMVRQTAEEHAAERLAERSSPDRPRPRSLHSTG